MHGGVSARVRLAERRAASLCCRHEVPPLRMGSVTFGKIPEGEGVLCEGGFEACGKMSAVFERKKGSYFEDCEYGTSLTPDSDQTVRIGVVAMQRMLVRCAAYRACYAKLNAAAAAALRAKVADRRGFAGLDVEETGYESAEALVQACHDDDWVLEKAALTRPLFPAVEASTGRILFTETFEVPDLCKRLIGLGKALGMHPHQVGAWSLRKDACEQPAAAGDGEVGARVLGHRHVNSRTMDRVYRADLRTRDLGAYWMRREMLANVEGAPMDSLSAQRVVGLGGVRSYADVPDGREREAAEGDEVVAY